MRYLALIGEVVGTKVPNLKIWKISCFLCLAVSATMGDDYTPIMEKFRMAQYTTQVHSPPHAEFSPYLGKRVGTKAPNLKNVVSIAVFDGLTVRTGDWLWFPSHLFLRLSMSFPSPFPFPTSLSFPFPSSLTLPSSSFLSSGAMLLGDA